MISRIIELTIVVSAMDPKLLIKMLQVTFTGGPAEREKRGKETEKLDFIRKGFNNQHDIKYIYTNKIHQRLKQFKINKDCLFCRG